MNFKIERLRITHFVILMDLYKNNEAINVENVINEFRLIPGNIKERSGK